MYGDKAIRTRKSATLSDKSARQEFGLTQEELDAAIRAGKLQFREGNMHGSPWLQLLTGGATMSPTQNQRPWRTTVSLRSSIWWPRTSRESSRRSKWRA